MTTNTRYPLASRSIAVGSLRNAPPRHRVVHSTMLAASAQMQVTSVPPALGATMSWDSSGDSRFSTAVIVPRRGDERDQVL